jgi:uncharacterized damage-inducible protein DinB
MPDGADARLLNLLLDSWERNNRILINLLRAIPPHALGATAAEGSPSIARMFMHIHYVRLVFVHEDAPEFATELPAGEWLHEGDPNRIAALLNDSATVVRDAFRGRLESGREMDLHYDHPVFFLQHMIWHEGYHHGQIKLALKVSGHAVDDEAIGPVTWDVWMDKTRRQ